MSHINIAFELPAHIKRGLETGLYMRKGGVVLNGNHQVVHWLREIPIDKATSSSLLAKGTSLGKAALSAADFLYLHENFKKIHLQLEQINLKIDAQNIAKVLGGLKLAKEAELMTDSYQAKNQISNAKTLLEDGTNTLQHILLNIDKREKRYREKRFHYLNLIVQAELGIVRAYTWEGEFDLARIRILQLKNFLLQICFQQLDDDLDPHIKWYLWPFLLPPTAVLYMYQLATKRVNHGKIEIKREVKFLNKKNIKLEKELSKVLIKVKENNYDLSEEVQSILTFSETLEGYELELKNSKIVLLG